MDELGNTSAAGVLRDVQTFLSERDDETHVGRVNGDDGSRFAYLYVSLPNGQEFKIVAEEVF